MFYYTLLFLRAEETEKQGLENTFLIEMKFLKHEAIRFLNV